MPATIKKVGKGRYQVRTPNQVHARSTTAAKARSQQRLLNAIDHGWKPDRTKRDRYMAMAGRR